MSHYEERLQGDLDRIKQAIAAVTNDVQISVERAIQALLARDRQLASRTILGDLAVNRATRAIDRQCHAFVARHLPAAGILRYVSSVMRLTIALERIGDYAVTICREAVALEQDAPQIVARDIEMMSSHTRATLAQAVESFATDNAELARGTMRMADQSTRDFDKVLADLIVEGREGKRAVEDLFALFVVLNRLERVSDQAKNICEETVFAVTGKQKAPKVYNVHFLDARNDCWSQMAEAYARKAYPESGSYSSSGWDPADALRPGLADFLPSQGLDLQNLTPTRLPTSHDTLAHLHVLVALQSGALEHLSELPFHTVLLEWDLGLDGEDAPLDDAFKRVSEEVRGLLETLHGDGAN